MRVLFLTFLLLTQIIFKSRINFEWLFPFITKKDRLGKNKLFYVKLTYVVSATVHTEL